MDHFALIQSLLERCIRGEQRDSLAAIIEAAIDRLGFGYFACCSHTDPLAPAPGAVMLHNYPTTWVRAFATAQLHKIDPVLRHAERSRAPFLWSAPEFRSGLSGNQKQILAAGNSIGLVGGYTVPIRLSWWPAALPASFSLVPNSGRIELRNYELVERLATLVYAAAIHSEIPSARHVTAPIKLSPRESTCLELAARGKTDAESSRILNCSESSVRTHILRVQARIGAARRAHAVAYALMTGQISLGDVRVRSPEEDRMRRSRRSRVTNTPPPAPPAPSHI